MLLELSDQIASALHTPLTGEECTALLSDLHEMILMARWCRDAGLELGQRASPPLSFRQMQEVTGIPHTTLYSRHRRWLAGHKEQEGSE